MYEIDAFSTKVKYVILVCVVEVLPALGQQSYGLLEKKRIKVDK